RMYNKKNIIKKIIALIAIIITFFVVITFGSPILDIASYWLTVITIIILAGVDISHPLVWFSASFGLYTTGHSIIYALEYPTFINHSTTNILLSLIALTIIVSIIGFKKNSDIFVFSKSLYNSSLDYKNNK